MPFLKDAVTLVKEPQQLPSIPLSWFPSSVFAAFNVTLLLFLSGLFFGFPCRWLVQNGEWAFPAITGPLFILTFFSLVSLNFSDPGILHRGEGGGLSPPGRSWYPEGWHPTSNLAHQDFFTPWQHFQDPVWFPVASEERAVQAGERNQWALPLPLHRTSRATY